MNFFFASISLLTFIFVVAFVCLFRLLLFGDCTPRNDDAGRNGPVLMTMVGFDIVPFFFFFLVLYLANWFEWKIVKLT